MIRPLSAATFFAAALTATATAQAPLRFDVDQPASQYTWSGTTSLGPLQGNPSNSFNLSGAQFVVLDGAPLQPLATGQFTAGGVLAVVGNLSGRIPNPAPFLPPLATITISNLTFELTTGPFSIAANGTFSTLADATILSGTVNVVPLLGSPTQQNLAGNQSTGQTFSGTIIQNGTTITGTSAQVTQFQFVDPGTGISATINLQGSLVARHQCAVPTNYCTAATNSTGGAAAISAQGSVRLQDQSLTLAATGLPQSSVGYFIFSESQAFVQGFGNGQGNLCLGAPIFRLSNFIQSSGTSGNVSLALPFNGLPASATLDSGESWNFQYWFRDGLPGGGATSNTSNGVRVVFCP